jgi:predicted metalloprotease
VTSAPRGRAIVVVLAVLALAGPAAGCGLPGSGGPGSAPPSIERLFPLPAERADSADPPPRPVPRTGPPPSATHDAPVDPADPPDAPDAQVPVPGQVDDPDVVEGAPDGAERSYEDQLPQILFLIDSFWQRALGRRYVRPAVYPAYEQNGPRSCGGEPLPRRNAVYCPVGHFVSWDESGLLRPYYERGGDMAVAFVLAHEWGHAAQALLGLSFPLTIFAELQADCLAGAWARDVEYQGLLEAGDVEEALAAIYNAADPEGTPWTAVGAHGDFEDRASLFAYGRENGAQACVNVMARYEQANPRAAGITHGG